jgi:hypothetical protein
LPVDFFVSPLPPAVPVRIFAFWTHARSGFKSWNPFMTTRLALEAVNRNLDFHSRSMAAVIT